MRVRFQRQGLVTALLVAVVATVSLYLAATVGLSEWKTSQAAPAPGAGALPTVVENAPAAVPTTSEYGPVGGISMIFAGTEVRDGLLGTLEHPWIGVSSHTGDYRAIDAPDLPPPGSAVMSISHDGNLLAWPTGEGLVVYDTVAGESRELAVDGVEQVGAFSPDSTMLLAASTELSVVDLAAGDVVASAEGDESVIRRTAWRADSSAVDFVSGQDLTTLVVGGESGTQATDIPEGASIAWSPTGRQLASLREVDGVNRLFLSDLGQDGILVDGQPVNTDGISLDRLIGFSGERTIAVVAYLLESGSVERILDIPLDGRSPSNLVTLPAPGENWADTGTLAIAADNLVAGSTEYPGQVWPWSYTARLVGCTLFVLFLLGLYVTRRPRSSRR